MRDVELLTTIVATAVGIAVIVAVGSLFRGGQGPRPSVVEVLHFAWMAISGKLKPWRGVADPLLTASRYALCGLTPDDVATWRTVVFDHTLDTKAQQIVTLVRAGWDVSDYRALGPRVWYDLDLLARAVTFGLTVDDFKTLASMPLVDLAMVPCITDGSRTRQEAMNWLTGVDMLNASSRNLTSELGGFEWMREIWRWKHALGADASWYAAAGFSFNEARALAADPTTLDRVKVMAGLRFGAASV